MAIAKASDPDRVAQGLHFLSEKPTDEAPAAAVASRPCPVCGQPMLVNTGLGVAFNVCPQHGTWLDRGKLQMLLAQMRGPGDAIKSYKRPAKIAKGAVSGTPWLMKRVLITMVGLTTLALITGCAWQTTMNLRDVVALGGPQELWLWLEFGKSASRLKPVPKLELFAPQVHVFRPHLVTHDKADAGTIQEAVVLTRKGLDRRIRLDPPTGSGGFRIRTFFRHQDTFWMWYRGNAYRQTTLFRWARNHFERLSLQDSASFASEHPGYPWDVGDKMTHSSGWRPVDVTFVSVYRPGPRYRLAWNGLKLVIHIKETRKDVTVRIVAEEPLGAFEPVVLVYPNEPLQMTDQQLDEAQRPAAGQKCYRSWRM